MRGRSRPMSTRWTPREYAEALVRVFARYVAQQDDDANRENLRVASEWLRLVEEPEPAAADIDSLATSLDSLPWAGSATVDLKLNAGGWAAKARRRAVLRRAEGG